MTQNNVFCAKPSDAGWPLIIRRQSSQMCISRLLQPEGNRRICCVGRELSPFLVVAPSDADRSFSYIFSNLCLRPSSIRSPLAPRRTKTVGLGVHGWGRVSDRGEARGRIRELWAKIVVAWSMILVSVVKLPNSCSQHMHRTKLRLA